MKRWKKIVLLWGLLAGAACTGEELLRHIPLGLYTHLLRTPTWFRQEPANTLNLPFPSPTFQYVHPLEASSYPFQVDGTLFWRLKASLAIPHPVSLPLPFLRTNWMGFRGPEVDPGRDQGAFRVLCLGDSCTFGWGPTVHEGAPFPRRLEQWGSLLEPNRHWQILNGGVPGYTSHQGRMLWQIQGRTFRPDLVILAFGNNDGTHALQTDREQARNQGQPQVRLKSWLFGWELYRFGDWTLRYAYQSVKGCPYRTLAMDQSQPRVPPADFRENLAAIIGDVQSWGGKVVLLNLIRKPAYRTIYSPILRELGAEMGCTSWDGTAFLQGVAEGVLLGGMSPELQKVAASYLDSHASAAQLYGDPIHPSALGHAFLALGLYHHLEQAGFLPGHLKPAKIQKAQASETPNPPRLLHLPAGPSSSPGNTVP